MYMLSHRPPWQEDVIITVPLPSSASVLFLRCELVTNPHSLVKGVELDLFTCRQENGLLLDSVDLLSAELCHVRY